MTNIVKVLRRICFVVIGLPVIVWVSGSAYFLLNSGDTKPETVTNKGVPPEEDAFPLFDALVKGVPKCFANGDMAELSDYRRGLTNGPEVAELVDRVVAAYADSFALMRQISKTGGAVYPVGGDPSQDLLRCAALESPLLAKIACVKAQREAEQGSLVAAERTLGELVDYGRSQACKFGVVSHLVGMGVAAMGLDASIRLAEEAGDAECLRRVLVRIQDLDASRLAFLRLALLGHLDGDGEIDFVRRQKDAIIASGGHNSEAGLLSYFLGYSGYSFKPNETLAEMRTRMKDLLKQIDERPFDPSYGEEWVPTRPPIKELVRLERNWVGRQRLEAFGFRVIYRKYYENAFNLRTLALTAAFQIYKLKHGVYPEEVSDLVPEVLSELPRDPYDGNPIRYNSGHRYFWTPGSDGEFDGKVDFDKDGRALPYHRKCRMIYSVVCFLEPRIAAPSKSRRRGTGPDGARRLLQRN